MGKENGRLANPQKREQAIRRLSKLGHPPRKIAKRLGLPLDVVQEALGG